jgi:hypothetical protein
LQDKANHVLSEDMTLEMLTPGTGHWGLGLEIGGSGFNPYFSHGGANEGFRNIFVAYETSGDGAVVMTNGDSGSLLGDEVIHSIATEYRWPDYGRSVVRRSDGLIYTILIVVIAAVIIALLLRLVTRGRVRQI